MIKLRILSLYDKLQFNVLGPFYRNFGKKLYRFGLNMQGPLASDDRIVPSLRSVSFNKQIPSLQNADFVAPNSVVVGQVELGSHSSIWYGASLRGDLGTISIGNNTLLQDLTSVIPRIRNTNAKIGNNVVIAPNTLLESCIIEDNSFLGMGSTLSQGSKVESFGVVAAGAVIKENTTVPSNQIWAGNPARYLRDISPEEREALNEHHAELIQLAKIHAEECEKTFREVIDDLDKKDEEMLYEPEELALKEMIKLGFPIEPEDDEHLEQRVFHEPNRHGENEEFPERKILTLMNKIYLNFLNNSKCMEKIMKNMKRRKNISKKILI